MEWRFGPGEYAQIGPIVTKRMWSHNGAKGQLAYSSDYEAEEMIFAIRTQETPLFVGVTDATPEAELNNSRACFGVRIDFYQREVQVFSCKHGGGDRFTLNAPKVGRELRGAGSEPVAEVRFATQHQRLLMSLDGEALQDIGFTLPTMVAPWVFLHAPGDAVEFMEVLPVPLQAFGRLDEGLVAVNTLSKEVGLLDGFGPEDFGLALAGGIREAVPAPPGARWKILLPSGCILEKDALRLPLRVLFAEAEEEEEEDEGEGPQATEVDDAQPEERPARPWLRGRSRSQGNDY